MLGLTPQTGWVVEMTRPEEVEQHVKRAARGQIYDLSVECGDGRLILRGRCRTYYAKQLAQQAALELSPPSIEIINEISILSR